VPVVGPVEIERSSFSNRSGFVIPGGHDGPHGVALLCTQFSAWCGFNITALSIPSLPPDSRNTRLWASSKLPEIVKGGIWWLSF
jgi:hypothetical protein